MVTLQASRSFCVSCVYLFFYCCCFFLLLVVTFVLSFCCHCSHLTLALNKVSVAVCQSPPFWLRSPATTHNIHNNVFSTEPCVQYSMLLCGCCVFLVAAGTSSRWRLTSKIKGAAAGTTVDYYCTVRVQETTVLVHPKEKSKRETSSTTTATTTSLLFYRGTTVPTSTALS